MSQSAVLYNSRSSLKSQANSQAAIRSRSNSSNRTRSEIGHSDTYKNRPVSYPRKGTTLGQIELTPNEEAHFNEVLARFDRVKLVEEQRIKYIRDELIEKQKARIHNAESGGDGRCYNCARAFMPVFNPTCQCSICQNEFCRLCLERLPKSKTLICKFCRFESVNRSRLGVWFTEELKQSRLAGRVRGVSGPEALRSSLVRLKRQSRASSLIQGITASKPDNSLEDLTYGSDSGYGRPRMENWLNESKHTPPTRYEPDQWNNSANHTNGRRTGSDASLPRSGTESYASSTTTPSMPGHSSHGPAARKITPSVSDVRSSGSGSDSGKKHRQRLTSEAGSKSTLSLASERSRMSHGSSLSLYSERESSYNHGIEITGDIRLDIQYDNSSSTLRVMVKHARDLAVVDKKHQNCSPYVKAYLLPDKTKASKRKTSSKTHNRNPVYEEEFKYRITHSEVVSRTLQISVWHKIKIGTNLFLGEVLIPFADHQFGTGAQWYPLSERRKLVLPPTMQIFRGELVVALKLIPGGNLGSQSEIHVWIKSAKGLTTSTNGRASSSTVDPYVKLYMMPEKHKSSKKKTAIVKKNNNPEWNTNFIYQNINRSKIGEIGLEVSVWDHDRMSSNDLLGGCRLNSGSREKPWMDATGTEQSIWLAMLERPQTWFEGRIRLRAHLD